jgi:plastocyanin
LRIFKPFSLALVIALVLALSLSLAAAAKAPVSSPQIYTVMVGWENPHQGIGIMAYFPDTVTIHVGDTVHWVQNSNEIHTVTFLDGAEPPDLIVPAALLGVPTTPSPLLFNPVAVDPAVPPGGLYDGTGFVNSGLMGREAGQLQEFSLTFTEAGTYDYMCLVHGIVMSGQVIVVSQDVTIPSPNQALAQGKQQMAEKLAQVPAVVRAAEMQVQPPVMNDDGSKTYHVMIGYNDGQIDLMQFFPDKLVVSPGDTVVWEMSQYNVAPHTVTFLNGQPEPSLVIAVPQQGAPPLLYINPEVLFPLQPATDLTRDGAYNSGIMFPIPGTTYTLIIGNMTPGLEPWVCQLHDTSGMEGTLMIVPSK